MGRRLEGENLKGRLDEAGWAHTGKFEAVQVSTGEYESPGDQKHKKWVVQPLWIAWDRVRGFRGRTEAQGHCILGGRWKATEFGNRLQAV